MARVPGAMPVKSRLHGALTAEGATALYRCFLLDRLDALARVPGIAPVVAFTPAHAADAMAALAPAGFALLPQHDGELGERLTRLLDGLLVAGHPGAIAMDSDSPTLPMAYVARAAQTLAEGAADVVLGPCDDGGYYLVGVRASRPALFEDIPWSTDAVLATTLARARTLGARVVTLPAWFDVDTEDDLVRLHTAMRAAESPPARTFAFVEALYG
ncbi:MAG TPA: TIGR04282 family arsenosugar biosynthesis glycosyltransferase [Candidatus Limnocylindria bacterium]|nr:TIGR04282 family arsenosugar biosynthesis glycosyltransferase [Candidatus Limnocylindria bacterium]